MQLNCAPFVAVVANAAHVVVVAVVVVIAVVVVVVCCFVAIKSAYTLIAAIK